MSCSLTPSSDGGASVGDRGRRAGDAGDALLDDEVVGSRPPRQSRTPRPPPPRTGLRSQRRARRPARPSAAGRVRGYASPAARSAAPSSAGSRTRRSVSGRAAEQRAPGGEPGDEVGAVLEAGAVDHALGGDRLGRLHELRHPAVAAEVAQDRHARAERLQVEVAEAVERDDVVSLARPRAPPACAR